MPEKMYITEELTKRIRDDIDSRAENEIALRRAMSTLVELEKVNIRTEKHTHAELWKDIFDHLGIEDRSPHNAIFDEASGLYYVERIEE